uniref:Secreted protein n=1 Tax=Macrostomum lignano TaxID=282301 RepID=A0A1I8FGV7_9PLAT
MLSRSRLSNEALPQLLARLSGRLSWPMRLATVGAESDTPVMELQTSFLVAALLLMRPILLPCATAHWLQLCLRLPGAALLPQPADGVPLAASDAADFVRVNVESSTGEAAGQLDLASVLSQVPHPQLGCPMYTLHPLPPQSSSAG